MASNSKEILASNLQKLMDRESITQKDIAVIAGVSQQSVPNWLAGKLMPRMGAIEKIAEYFDVAKSDLLEMKDGYESKATRIPVLGTVKAGIPITAVQEILDYEEISSEMARCGEYFALRIKGDSMEPRMHEGDVVIVKKQSTVDSGQIAIVLVNGDEATVKKVRFRDNGIELIAFNSYAYEPHFYSAEEIQRLPVEIIGRVVELRAKF